VTVLGRYRLDEQVGQGGMAVVWRGFDTQLMRTVAVKVLHAHLLQRQEIRRRFSREAHAVARLHHPHILDIYDFSGPEAEPSYLVTEFIPGASLRAFADRHPFDPPELAAACAVSLAEALEHAHAANVVHRDLKPENVMVRDDGVVKLTDFGLAALLDPDENLTATGAILGSPAHLSPEAIEGKTADPRSDLFSLGTVLYWLACGQLPFQAKTPAALLRQILEGSAPDPRTVRPSVSDGLALLISRLLERDPEKRIQSASDAKKAMVALLAESGIDEPAKTLAAFVSSKPPEAAAQELREKLVARCLAQGDAATQSKRTGAALSAYLRALALQPGNAVAAARVEKIRNRTRVLKRVKAIALALGFAVLVTLVGTQLAGVRRAREAARQQEAARVLAEENLRTRPEVPAPLPGTDRLQAAPAAVQIDPAPIAPSPGSTERASNLSAADEESPIRQRHLASQRESTEPHPGRPDEPTVDATLNVHWVWAHVLIDGVDLGEKQIFKRRLTVGAHRVTVSHLCCLDSSQTIDVEPGQTRYVLEPGKPKPARLSVPGAPPDSLVLIDGVSMGSSQALDTHELPMTDRPSREVLLTVGDRSSRVTLEAGRTNQIDYLKMAQGAP